MLRLLKLGPRLLLLRWLPFGFATRWLLRLGIWSGIGYTVYRALKPPLQPLKAPAMPPSQSGWAPPVTSTPNESARAFASVDDVAVEEALIDDIVADVSEAEAIANEVIALELDPDDTVVAETISVESDGLTTIDLEIESPATVNWVRGDGTEHCPPGYPVKAKASSLIYHTDESRNYEVTIPDVCFASAEDAAAAGYRAPFR